MQFDTDGGGRLAKLLHVCMWRGDYGPCPSP
jgi:hypothetical protein